MTNRIGVLFLLTLIAEILLAPGASAQSLGPYRWQLQPFCNVLELRVFQEGATFILEGFDDQCGGTTRTAIVGSAFLNPDGSITLV